MKAGALLLRGRLFQAIFSRMGWKLTRGVVCAFIKVVQSELKCQEVSYLSQVRSLIIPVIGQLILAVRTISGTGCCLLRSRTRAMALLPQFLSSRLNHPFQPVQNCTLGAVSKLQESLMVTRINNRQNCIVNQGSNAWRL